MKVININFENKTFETEDGTEYPFMFNVDESMTLEEFQALVNESKNIVNKLFNG